MTKTKEEAALNQPVATSAQLNQAIRDYIQMALLIGHSQGHWGNGLSAGLLATITHLWFPFTPATNVYDRMRIHGADTIVGSARTVEYTLNSGGAWVALPAPVASGLPVSDPAATTANANQYDINIAAAVGPFLGLRTTVATPGAATLFAWNWMMYLWRSTDTPY